MDHSRMNSPPRLTKQNNSSSEMKSPKSKIHLPSRYMQDKSIQKTGFHDILNEIETHVKEDQTDKIKQTAPQRLKTKNKQLNINEYSQSHKESVFKVKPLKREESDIQNFNQIFLNPREQALKQLQKFSKTSDKGKTISKEYQKLLQFQNGFNMDEKKQQLSETDMPKHYQQCIEMLDSEEVYIKNTNIEEENFFEEHIRMDPPQYPNNSSSSTIAQGSGYAPSIPPNIKSNKQSNVKELLMRAKAGMNTDDIEKQAHLSYFLGEVYEEKKKFSSALKFYKRFLGFAKAMQDKIGMCLGSNRVAVNYFKNGDIQKSIVFHNQNLKLSDTENCFTGFYNLGICYRRLNKLSQSLQYFESAFNWAHEKGQQESECIALGQIGVTYFRMELFQQSLQNFEKSLEISQKIKNNSMELNNLRYILRISSQFSLKPIEVLDGIAYNAYQCSKNTTDIRLQNILRSNLGILRGCIQFINKKKELGNDDEVEQIS